MEGTYQGQWQHDELACFESRLGVTASGQLAPAMNNVGIDAVCPGDLGYRCLGPGALRHYLRFVVMLYCRHLTAFSLVVVPT
jgi:hypothetical protein